MGRSSKKINIIFQRRFEASIRFTVGGVLLLQDKTRFRFTGDGTKVDYHGNTDPNNSNS